MILGNETLRKLVDNINNDFGLIQIRKCGQLHGFENMYTATLSPASSGTFFGRSSFKSLTNKKSPLMPRRLLNMTSCSRMSIGR